MGIWGGGGGQNWQPASKHCSSIKTNCCTPHAAPAVTGWVAKKTKSVGGQNVRACLADWVALTRRVWAHCNRGLCALKLHCGVGPCGGSRPMTTFDGTTQDGRMHNSRYDCLLGLHGKGLVIDKALLLTKVATNLVETRTKCDQHTTTT